MKEIINILPDRAIYPKLGQAGYSISEAIAELVDNAIDARYEDMPVSIEIVFDKNSGSIEVKDNGIGMEKEVAARSIILGYSKKVNKLGQFGLGLKTACESLGKNFSISTSYIGSDEEYILEFDEEDWLRSGDWTKFPLKIKKGVDKNYSGTVVKISNLRVSLYPNLITNIKHQLSDRFAPFLLNREAKIKVNTLWVEPEQPKILKGSKKLFTISLSDGKEIKGWSGILMEGSQEKSGFNLFRYGRLIRAHEKLGYNYHPSKMWIVGEVHLDCVPVTHNKREFITTSLEYEEFFEKFQEVIKPILAEAQQKHRELKIRDLSPEKKETLKDNLFKTINDMGEYKELAFPATGKQANRSTDEKGELFEQERRDLSEEVGETKILLNVDDVRDKKRIRKPKKKQPNKVRFLTVAGKKYQFDWDWRDLDERTPKFAELDKQQNKIIVYLNSRFPALTIVKDEIFYIATFVAEGIAEVFCSENNRSLDRVQALRDETLYRLAKIITEDIDIKKGRK